MLPETLTCTDLDQKNPFCVERAKPQSAFDATPEDLAEEMGRVEAHQEYGKTLYWTSRNVLNSHHFIPTVADAATLEIGETIATQRKQIATRQEETQRRVRTNRALIEKEGLRRELIDAPTDVVQSIKRLRDEAIAEETP
jgi:undecaprenyl pyrophosphate synthase